jgi:uncharacterized protein (DUF3820 family)
LTEKMTKTLPFGKYKGCTIAEVLADDPEYLQWLCSQDDFRSGRGAIYRDIIDCVEGLADASERKVMRERFRDQGFCRRFLQTSGHEAVLLHELELRRVKALGKIADRLRSLEETTNIAKIYTGAPSHQAWAHARGIFLDPADRERQIVGFEQIIATLHKLRKRIADRIEAPKLKISCRFEQHGFDVVMRASIRYPWEGDLGKNYLSSQDGGIKSTIAVKIRRTASPTVVRWIGENRNIMGRAIADDVVLLAGDARFAATTEIKVVFAADLAGGASPS